MTDVKVHTVLQPVEGAPDKPVRYELEITPGLTPILTQTQDGFPNERAEQMFVDLRSLVELGHIAQSILDEEGER